MTRRCPYFMCGSSFSLYIYYKFLSYRTCWGGHGIKEINAMKILYLGAWLATVMKWSRCLKKSDEIRQKLYTNAFRSCTNQLADERFWQILNYALFASPNFVSTIENYTKQFVGGSKTESFTSIRKVKPVARVLFRCINFITSQIR